LPICATWGGAPTTPTFPILSAIRWRILQEPDVRRRFAELGLDIIGSDAKAFAAFIRQDIETWAKVAREAKIRLE